MTLRQRVTALAILALLLVAATAGYVVSARTHQEQAARGASALPTLDVSTVTAGPRIVFRNTALGPGYGMVAMVRLTDPGGPRAVTTTACDRVFAAAGRTLCLAVDRGVATRYTATTWTGVAGPVTDLPLTGIPSRARLSDDATLAATTTFVSGDSYAGTSFSTRTVISRVSTGTRYDLETFRLLHRGRPTTSADRNYWGVTFAPDDDHFYVTVKLGGQTWLATGQLTTRTIRTLRPDAECPSLSPDGTKVAYKKLGPRSPGDWRLAVLDLATGTETALAEQRSVDDQVEWLDSGHVLYGLPGVGSHAAESNVWVVPADGSGSPRLLIPKAWSPAVVR